MVPPRSLLRFAHKTRKIAEQAIFYLANSESSPIIVVFMFFSVGKNIETYKCNRLLEKRRRRLC
jgi:hypothetical protein